MQAPIATFVTKPGIAAFGHSRNARRVLPRLEFLRLVEERAKSRAEMARVLGVSPARITEMHKLGGRKLTYDEAVTLAERYEIGAVAAVSAARLHPLLEICLRQYPAATLSAQDVEQLAEDVEFALELLHSFGSEEPSQDAVEVARRSIAARHRYRHA